MADRFEQFTSAVSCIYQSVLKIQRSEMINFGLKGGHVQCLLAMAQHREGITVTELSQFCQRDKAAISRTVMELEKLGMVSRGKNSYRALLRLTEQGNLAAQQVQHRANLAVQKAGEGLTDADREIFYATLFRIAGNLQEICRDGLET